MEATAKGKRGGGCPFVDKQTKRENIFTPDTKTLCSMAGKGGTGKDIELPSSKAYSVYESVQPEEGYSFSKALCPPQGFELDCYLHAYLR